MISAGLPGNAICRDLSGTLTFERTPEGAPYYLMSLGTRVSSPGYHHEIARLQQTAGPWAVPLREDGASGTRLSFDHNGWKPFTWWWSNLKAGPFFPLERALSVALDLCTTFQQVQEDIDEPPEAHSGVVLISEATTPRCRLLVWPRVGNARPADYLRCTPDVVLCTPPEALCGQPAVHPMVYATGIMLRLIFAGMPTPEQRPSALIEQVVGEGLPSLHIAPSRLPPGMNRMLRLNWEELANLIARATARCPKTRDVTLEQLGDACQEMLDSLDYWTWAEKLRHEGRYEEACDVCRYGVWARADDVFLRPALKRKCGSIYLEDLHKYGDAATLFLDYLDHETHEPANTRAQVREAYGDALAAKGEHTEALDIYERALATIADRARLYLKIADTYRRHRNYPKAIETLNRLFNDNARHWRGLQDMAEIYLEQEKIDAAHGQAALALEVVHDLLNRRLLNVAFPKHVLADLHAILGMCYLRKGQESDAQMIAAKALEEYAGCYRAHNIFGLMYVGQERIVSAMRSFGASLRLKPDQPEIQCWLEEALSPPGG
jgi:tetratricopeptide (TPR) repeat protein